MKLQTAILLTLAYSAQFEYPLTTRELYIRLIRIGEDKRLTSKQTFVEALVELVVQGFVRYDDEYWALSGQETLSQTRTERALATQEKFIELKPLLRFMNWLPGVAGVAITGSAAVQNASAEADVDFLIVTEKNRLWLIRPLVVFFAYLYGKRRTWAREEKNSWCFNLWLERDSLAQPTQTHSLYVAYEVCQAQWLISNQNCKESFYYRNAWAASYLPNFYSWSKVRGVPSTTTRTSATYWPVVSELATIANLVGYGVQRAYMHRHITREKVQYNAAFFHPRDTSSQVSRSFRAIVERL